MTDADVSVVRRLHEHRIWANHRLAESAAMLDDRQLRQTFPIGQGSVWQSLLHMVAAEYVWLEALQGDDDPLFPGDLKGRLPGNQDGQATMTTIAELLEFWSHLNARWQAYLSALEASTLEQTVFKYSTSSGEGKRHATCCRDVLIHVCTHAHYTGAQVVNMLRQLEIENLPDLMLITLARQSVIE